MTVFIDTSALYSLLDENDQDHARARAAFADLVGAGRLITHNYVLVECSALVHRRLGADAARSLLADMAPVLAIAWVDAELHQAATSAFIAAGRREVSLVDWTSFEIMRRRGIGTAFAFDDDFAQEGFELVPRG